MKYETAGVYEVPLTATDDCDNETVGEREVLVARNIIAGDNVTLTQDGNDVTIDVDVCGALDECETITEMQSDIEGKQDTLTAGDNITIENGVISADDPDLSDYYTKSETYNKSEVDALIEAIETGEFIIVQTLPQTGDPKSIYLVPKQGGGYTEYVYINGSWEELGDTDIDLSDYYTKSETDALIADFLTCSDLANCQTISDMQDDIDGKQDTLTAGQNIQIAQDGTISATDTVYTAGQNVQISNNNVISATDTTYNVATQSANGLMSSADKTKLDSMTPADYLTCANVLNCQSVSDALDAKQDELTAGNNITIQNGTISAIDTTYTAGNHITIAQDGTISATNMTKAEILAELGYTEIEMSMTDTNNQTLTAKVLGYVVQ